MTQIIISANQEKGVLKYKNPFWEKRNETPNEAYESSTEYRTKSCSYLATMRRSLPGKFFEVRIIDPNAADLEVENAWFQKSAFVDQVFWVYQQPIELRVDPTPGRPFGRGVSFYVLEMLESARIRDILWKKYHEDVGALVSPFVVPVTCCDLAWNETAAGVSEHLHYRPQVAPTQEEIDRKARIQEEARALLEQAADVSNDDVFTEGLKKVTERLKDKQNELGKTQEGYHPARGKA